MDHHRRLTKWVVVVLAGLSACPGMAAAEPASAEEVAVLSEAQDPNSPGFTGFNADTAPMPKAEVSPPVAASEGKEQKRAHKKHSAGKGKKRAQAENEPGREIPLIDPQNDRFVASDVSYVTGGIGEEERQSIEAAKHDYNLQVMSASVTGAFVGDARVEISREEQGQNTQVLSVVSGPLLYVKLSKGSYIMDASVGEQTRHYRFQVGKKTTRIHLGWRAPVQD